MGTFGKVFLGIVGTCIVAVIVGTVLLVSNLDSVVASLIEEIGTEVTGTNVSVDSVEISLKEGAASIHGLRIANPEGYPAGNALEIGLAAVALDLGETASELVVIKSILIDGAKLSYLQQGRSSNLQTIQSNLGKKTSGETVDSGGDGSDARIIVDEFRFLNAEAYFSSPALGVEKTVTIPDIDISGVGRKSVGVTASEAARQILEPIIQEAMQAAVDSSVDDLKQQGRQKIEEKAKEKLKSLFD